MLIKCHGQTPPEFGSPRTGEAAVSTGGTLICLVVLTNGMKHSDVSECYASRQFQSGRHVDVFFLRRLPKASILKVTVACLRSIAEALRQI